MSYKTFLPPAIAFFAVLLHFNREFRSTARRGFS